jgi:FMN-dependent NADH-azoreductase
MRLLHLDSSIQGDNSASRAISAAIVEQFRSADPDLDVVYRDLAAAPPAHLTLDAFATAGESEILAEFQRSDIVVIGAPLYNFTVPSQLKAWIDRILVAGQTFRYSERGPEGLAGDKRVIVALARGAVYGDGSPFAAFEHAETLLRSVFAFIGIGAPEFIVAEGLGLGGDARIASIAAALDQAGRLAPLPVALGVGA